MSTPSTITELNSFSGGINNVTAPYLIAKDESVTSINMDIKKGAMWSMPVPLLFSQVQHTYFYQFNNVVYSYGSWRSNALWDNRWYWTDGVDTGKVLIDGTEKTLGLPSPIAPLTIAPEATAGPHKGDFKYTYTFYDNTTGVESAPAPLTTYLTIDQFDILVSGFEVLPADATHYRLYRIGGYLPYFTLVDTLEGTVTSYIDTLDDTQIDGRLLQTIRNGAPPEGIKYFTEMNGRLYGSVDNKLYFSALGNPDSWYVYDSIPFQNIIKGIAKVPGGLLVIGDKWTNILKGSDPINFRAKVVSDKIGIVDASSIAYIDETAIWLAENGVVISNGYTIQQVTIDKIEDLKVAPVGANVTNNVYYLGYRPQLVPHKGLYPRKDLHPSGTSGNGTVDQGVIAIDFKRGHGGYSYRLIETNNLIYLGTLNGDVAGVLGKATHALECEAIAFPECLDYISCSGNELVYLAKSSIDNFIKPSNLMPLSYLSPVLIDGTTVTMKEYDKVRISFKGIFIIQILFDNDRLLLEREIVSLVNNEYDYAEIGIPNTDNKAYSIRFKIEGIGVIKGIQYSKKFRELP